MHWGYQLTYASSTSTTGMAHAHRNTALPHPAAATQISTREIYSPATPSFRRGPEHTPRSPSFPGNLRRTHISPTPSPSLGFTPPIAASLRMDPSGYGSKSQQNIPPLLPLTQLGTLTYADANSGGQPIKIEINGTIDKGFFLADNEWTCYRRNYFSCVCSYNLTPYYPNSVMQWTDSASQQTYRVYGFAMSISALVADSEGHTIELVQHTPKRDKGPIAAPDKVRLNPKPPQAQHHPLNHFGQPDMGMAGSSRMYEQSGGYGAQQGSLPIEHTFERIQFKQATANNGKRRAAQQYYHLMVELYADIGPQGNDQYKKIAYRKSEKMIVRGRSPGHYQSERRGSTSSGPGGSAGSMGGYAGSQVRGGDYGGPNSGLLGGGYAAPYDTRNTGHYRTHHELPGDPMLTADDAKAISEPKEYQYYPHAIYENNQDPRQNPVEMFPSQRNEPATTLPHMASGLDYASKTKSEYDQVLPSLFYPGQAYHQRGCGRFEGKSSSGGYYPAAAMIHPPTSSGMNMT